MAKFNRYAAYDRNNSESGRWVRNSTAVAEYIVPSVQEMPSENVSASEVDNIGAVGAVGAYGAVGASGGTEEAEAVQIGNTATSSETAAQTNSAAQTAVSAAATSSSAETAATQAVQVQTVPVADHAVQDAAQNNQNTATTATNTPTVAVETSHAATESSLQAGITLDIARHYYSVDVIKQYIDTISTHGGGFLQLHISDNENYGFESSILGQTTANARLNADGSYTNLQTGRQFLSYEQINSITAYAKQAGVEIIPDIDSPSHIGGMLNLLNYSKGTDFVSTITSSVVGSEINITSTTAIQFMQSLYQEVIGLMNGTSRHFHIGGDEFGYSVQNNFEFINYVNEMNDYLNQQGITTRIWNDGLIKSNLADLNHNVEVTYWSYDGNTGNAAVSAEREALRADMQDLLDNGFDVLNYNSYYLYYVPNSGSNAESGAYMAKEIQATWDLDVWDKQDTSNLADDSNSSGKIIGASLAVWGEHADGVSSSDIYEWSDNSFAALAAKLNMKTIDFSALENISFELNQDTPVNEVWNVSNSVSELLSIQASDDFLAHGNAFLWIEGEFGDVLSMDSGWAASGASALQGDTSYTLYKNGNNHVYVDTDIAVNIL